MFLSVAKRKTEPLWVENIGWEKNPARTHWGPGRRQVHILHYVLDGSGFFNGSRVCKGQGFYIAPDLWQEYHPDGQQPWEYFWIIFGGELAKKYVDEVICPDEKGLFFFSRENELEKRIARMQYAEGELSHFAALSWMYQVLDLHTVLREEENPIVRRAKAYIRANYHTPITVRSVAQTLHVNDRYLYNLFVRWEDTTPKRYIDECRIRAACELLSQLDTEVTDVARAVGFDDVSRFSRFFSLHTGVSPTKYRKGQKSAGE